MIRRALGMMAVLMMAPALARPAVLALEPIDDVSIFEDSADNASGVDPVLYVGNTRFGSPRRCLLRFDLSALPANAVVSAVSLTVFIERAQGNPGPETHTLHRVTTAWDEGPTAPPDPGAGGLGTPAVAGDATWNDASFGSVAWTTPGGDYVGTASGNAILGIAGTSSTFSGAGLAADVAAWRAAPATNHGWIMRGDESLNFNARRLHSAEATNAAQRPRLDITFTVPAATATDAWMIY